MTASRNSKARERIRQALSQASAAAALRGDRDGTVELRIRDARDLLEDADKLAEILTKLERDVRALERGARARRRRA